MEVTIDFLWRMTQLSYAMLFIAAGILGMYLRSEIGYLKKAMSVILASDEELAKKVIKFTGGKNEDEI